MNTPEKTAKSPHKRQIRLTAILLGIWAIASFGLPYWASDLSLKVWGWPFHFWMAAQGALLIFLVIVVIYAWLMNHWEAQKTTDQEAATKAPSQG